MTTWLIPANTKFYDVFGAFGQGETYWPINANVSAGDTVYIYLAAPHKQIGFCCAVLATGYQFADIRQDVLPFIKGDPDQNPVSKPFMLLKVTRSFPIHSDSALSLQHLRESGLNGMLMGARKLENNPDLFDYIKGNTT